MGSTLINRRLPRVESVESSGVRFPEMMFGRSMSKDLNVVLQPINRTPKYQQIFLNWSSEKTSFNLLDLSGR